MDEVTLGAVSLGAASVLLLVLAWAIGGLARYRRVPPASAGEGRGR